METEQGSQVEQPKAVEIITAVSRSKQLGELVKALTAAQLKFSAVKKDAENPAYTRGNKRSMYATLDSVIGATREALAQNGLAIIALPQEMVDDKRLKITSILIHHSDQFIESTLTMTAVDKVTPQELGKLITYARRYQWTSLTGTAPEDDTDGNESSGVGSKEAQQEVVQRKLAEHGAPKTSNGAAAFKPKTADPIKNLSVVPMDGGDSLLMGDGLPKLLTALDTKDPHFKKTFMHYDEGKGFWYVRSGKAFILVDICTSIGVNAVLADGDKTELDASGNAPKKAVNS